jgi:spermidine synthase
MRDTATGEVTAESPAEPATGPAAEPHAQPAGEPPAAVSSRLGRIVVLAATFACAACGLVYELALIAQGSYLLGDSR